MSEKVSLDVREILLPQNTPEMGFESYKMLEGKKEVREQLREDFFAGKIRNPSLDYPRIDESVLDEGINNLNHVLTIADSFDVETREAVWNSAAYRMAEMYWLKSLVSFQDMVQRGTPYQIKRAASQHQQLNEELFGAPSEKLSQAIFSEALKQINAKNLTENGRNMLEDLMNGFQVEIEEGLVYLPPLAVNETASMPEFKAQALQKLLEIIKKEYGFIYKIVEDYYKEEVESRPEEEKSFSSKDVLNLFNLIKLADNGPTSEAKIIWDEDVTSLSWDTQRGAIVVGGRHVPIKGIDKMVGKLFHEYAVHAGRSLKGIKSDLPVLGTGIFTEPYEENTADYLTFEEGFATVCEMAINGNKQKWEPIDLEKSAAIALAYRGYDFRQVFETLWRIRVLMLSKNGVDTDTKSLAKAKRNSYKNTERIFRGTPSAMPRTTADGTSLVITYNKDLAYLAGKIKALDFIEKADEESIRMAFMGKYDPSNPKQLKIAQKYLS